MEILNIFNVTSAQWIWLILASFLIGASKTGISAFMMPAIPVIASVFGGKESTGIILPMLIVGDAFALHYYNRHADWNNIKKLLLWVFIGLTMGILVGNYISDKQFKIFIAISVMICLALLVYTDRKGEDLKVPTSTWFYALTGILTGFTSMIGNAAGPIFSVYLLAKGFKKNNFLGTTAWFFLIINISKVPLQILFWKNISLKTISLDLIMIPAIALGAVLGAFLIKKISEKPFRLLILVMTAAAAVKLFI